MTRKRCDNRGSRASCEEAAKERAAARQAEQDQAAGGRRGRLAAIDAAVTTIVVAPISIRITRTADPRKVLAPRRGGVALLGRGTGGIGPLGDGSSQGSRSRINAACTAAAFEDAVGGFDVDYDSPNYLGYFVQRAEVVPGQEFVWQDIPVYDAKGTTDPRAGRKYYERSGYA